MSRNAHKIHKHDRGAAALLQDMEDAKRKVQHTRSDLVEHNNILNIHAEPETKAPERLQSIGGAQDVVPPDYLKRVEMKPVDSISKPLSDITEGFKADMKNCFQDNIWGAQRQFMDATQEIAQSWMVMQLEFMDAAFDNWANMMELSLEYPSMRSHFV